MKLSFEREVEARLDGRPHLLPLFDHVLRIPQRVWEYRPTLFVVINTIRNLEKAMGVPAEDLTRVPQGILPRYGAWLEIHDLAQMVATKYAPNGKLRALSRKNWKMYEMDDWNWLDEDGAVLSRVSGKAVWEATLAKYCDLGCDLPRGNVDLTGLTEA